MLEREFETTRLRLRPCRVGDAELLHALWTEKSVRRFLFDERVISPDEARAFVEASAANFEQCGYGLWLVFAHDELIGFAGFLRLEEETPNLVYGIHPDHWGKGYATEAACVVLSYALESLVVPLVKADVDEPNVLSVRVLEKLGMRRTGRDMVAGRPIVYFEASRDARAV